MSLKNRLRVFLSRDRLCWEQEAEIDDLKRKLNLKWASAFQAALHEVTTEGERHPQIASIMARDRRAAYVAGLSYAYQDAEFILKQAQAAALKAMKPGERRGGVNIYAARVASRVLDRILTELSSMRDGRLKGEKS